MRLCLLHPGAAARGPLDEAARDYLGRVQRRVRAEELFLKPSRREEPEAALKEEAERLRGTLGDRDLVVALDRTGEAWSSETLASHLDTWLLDAPPRVAFILGSSHGIDPGLSRSARLRWSFGRLTLPHDLARVVFWEQIYRAFTIREGGPYHK